MRKKFKAPRGYYRQIKELGFKDKKIKLVEFWLKHLTDKSKDVHFYVHWNKPSEIGDAWDRVASTPKEGYADHVLARYIHQPRRKSEKLIYSSLISSVPHLDQLG